MSEPINPDVERLRHPEKEPARQPAGTTNPAAASDGTAKPAKGKPAAKAATTLTKPKPVPKGGIKAAGGCFMLTDNGVTFSKDDDEADAKPQTICGRLEVVAQVRDGEGRNWCVLARFLDLDGDSKELMLPRGKLLNGESNAIPEELANAGLFVSTAKNARPLLLAYLQTGLNAERARLVKRTGWHGDAFLLPDGTTIGSSAEPLIFESGGGLPAVQQAGSLADWQQHIAAHCAGNHRFAFALAAAFAASLLEPCGVDSGGLHFFGSSSAGKTTLLLAAASVYGPPERYKTTWRSTDNALEGTAAAHSDGLLILDEIHLCEPRVIGEATYMLSEGKGKARANDKGAARAVNHWRTLFLSAGELTLSDHMASAGKEAKAGMLVRLLEIPADAGMMLGMFDHCSGFATPGELAEHLKRAGQQYHGTPLLKWLEYVASRRVEIAGLVLKAQNNFLQQVAPKGAAEQVRRVANRFALIALAGELASEAGITGWRAGVAGAAAAECFKAWLRARGGTANHEDRQILRQLRLFLEQNGEARFTAWDGERDPSDGDHRPKTLARCGFRKQVTLHPDGLAEGAQHVETTYYVMGESWASEVLKGRDLRRANAILLEMGVLLPGEVRKETGKAKPSCKVRLPGTGGQTTRVYVVLPTLWSLQDDDD